MEINNITTKNGSEAIFKDEPYIENKVEDFKYGIQDNEIKWKNISESDKRDGILLANKILNDGDEVFVETNKPFLLPAWFDGRKFKRGQTYFHRNNYSMMIGKLNGLLSILAIPSILRVLILTGKSSEPLTAFRRYVNTILHMLDWYNGDICNPNSKCRRSLLAVRSVHCGASKMASGVGYGSISQKDMAITQFGFIGFSITAPEKLGIIGTDEDVEGLIHFWKTIGHFLGIKEEFNLFRGSVNSTKVACQIIMKEAIARSFDKPEKEFHAMADAMIKGMWAIVPVIYLESVIDFTRHLCDLPVLEGPRQLHCRILLNLQYFVLQVLLNNYIIGMLLRPILNFNMWLAMEITQRFPLLAFLTFSKNIHQAQPQYSLEPSLIAT